MARVRFCIPPSLPLKTENRELKNFMPSPRHTPGPDEVQHEIDIELSLPRKRELLRIDEVADVLRRTDDHVRNLIDAGELVAVDTKSNPNGSRSSLVVTRASFIAFLNRRKKI